MGTLQRTLSKMRNAFRTEKPSRYLHMSLFLSKLSGAFPYRYTTTFRRSKASVGLFALVVASSWASTFYFVRRIRQMGPSEFYATKLQETIELVQLVIADAALTLNFFWSLKNSSEFEDAYARLADIDRVLRSYSRVSYDAGKIVFYDLLAVLLVCAQSGLLASQYYFRLSAIYLVYLYCVNLPYLALHSICQPLYALLEMSGRQAVHLRRCASGSPGGLRVPLTLAKLHSRLCSVLSTVGDAYSFTVLVTTASVFLVIVSNLYFIIVRGKAVHYDVAGLVWYLSPELVWIGYWILEQWLIVSFCADAVSKSREFNRALFQLIIEDETNQLAKSEKLQLHIAMKSEAYFSACGLFPIDYTLIHSMIAAATTYLVILVQFDEMNN